jgi:hypothetical protein
MEPRFHDKTTMADVSSSNRKQLVKKSINCSWKYLSQCTLSFMLMGRMGRWLGTEGEFIVHCDFRKTQMQRLLGHCIVTSQ